MRLDGVDLPKPITFDLEEEDAGNLPKSQLSFMCDAEHGSVMAKTFIEQYYQIFDSDDRSPLLQAYHDTAHFSIMCHIGSSDSHSMFSNFIADNRNLLRFDNSGKRLKQLKIGKHSIVGALKSFTGTEHDPTTFVVDLVFFTPALIQLIVSGLFREKVKPTSGSAFKYFSRTFIIVPVGAGFCIVNEELCLHYPTSAQMKQMTSKPKPPVSAMPAPGPSAIAPPVVNGDHSDILAKQQMVTDLAAKSGMNLIWSEKCLNETNWNLEQALFAFMQLREAGTIPMEAFQK
uniref:Nuclear RNA export factor 1 n=1 Tax=Lygus hesperus TaxID=30085 RepID=A0A146LCB2_LYGHE